MHCIELFHRLIDVGVPEARKLCISDINKCATWCPHMLTRKMDTRLNRELDVMISLSISFLLSLMPRRQLPSCFSHCYMLDLFLISFSSTHFHSRHCCSEDQTSQP